MNSAFISGIPAVGKSFLAQKLSKEFGIQHIDTDTWRESLCEDPKLKEWVMFYWNLDEQQYWETTSCDEQWKNLVNQSEAFWKVFNRKIKEILKTNTPTIFEGVNLLPHLMISTLDLQGIYLLSDSVEEIFEHIKRDPRWGNTEELQKQEAEAFVNCAGLNYQREAEKYNYPVFFDSVRAAEILKTFITG